MMDKLTVPLVIKLPLFRSVTVTVEVELPSAGSSPGYAEMLDDVSGVVSAKSGLRGAINTNSSKIPMTLMRPKIFAFKVFVLHTPIKYIVLQRHDAICF